MILLASYYYTPITPPNTMLCHTSNYSCLIYSVNQISITSKVNELCLVSIYLVMSLQSLFILSYLQFPIHFYILVNSIYLFLALMPVLFPRASTSINPLSTSINNQIIMCQMYLCPSSSSHYLTPISPRCILYIYSEHSSTVVAPNPHIMSMPNYKMLI